MPPKMKNMLSASIPYLDVIQEIAGAAGGPAGGAAKALVGLLKILEKAGDNVGGFEDLVADASTLVVVLNDWRNDSPGHHLYEAAQNLEDAIDAIKQTAGEKLSHSILIRLTNVKLDSDTIARLKERLTLAVQVYEVASGLKLNQGLEMLDKRSKWNHASSILAHHKKSNVTFDNNGPDNLIECQDGTRVDMLDKLIDWVTSRRRRLGWMTGPAGAGKTAISRTLCKKLRAMQIEPLSFFLFKASGRNSLAPLIPAFISQLVTLFPSIRLEIADIFDKDSDICGKSFATQFEVLFIPILQRISSTSSVDSPPILFVIDGLDEGEDTGNDVNIILQLIIHHLPNLQKQVKFLISSRQERKIQEHFDANCHMVHHVVVPSSMHDIRIILRHGLDKIHRRRQDLPPTWPTNEDFEQLVEHSSGYPIHAKVVLEYMSTGGIPPAAALRDVLLWASRGSEDPMMGGLESLFYGILSAAQAKNHLVCEVLELVVIYTECHFAWPSSIMISMVADILSSSNRYRISQLDQRQRLDLIMPALHNLRSLVSFDTLKPPSYGSLYDDDKDDQSDDGERDTTKKRFSSPNVILGDDPLTLQNLTGGSKRMTLQFYHKSLSDFLLSKGVSKELFVDIQAALKKTILRCIRLLKDPEYLTNRLVSFVHLFVQRVIDACYPAYGCPRIVHPYLEHQNETYYMHSL
ncbi:hypothetical protein CPB83DRAFT_264240 [Crepidotus variabilis]|uniref:Nephrocystin 3-like N-terminal domain-containing protein n=1 Tax=Crepidotus variabilis TaxID=179855 RepID=A0A9P6JR55_9AGAR|nr:hypothetical protein CPB83DRAFT_264240 [Crepidotus variabilis]